MRNELGGVDILFYKYPSTFFGGAWFTKGRPVSVTLLHFVFLLCLWLFPYFFLPTSTDLSETHLLSLFISVPPVILYLLAYAVDSPPVQRCFAPKRDSFQSHLVDKPSILHLSLSLPLMYALGFLTTHLHHLSPSPLLFFLSYSTSIVSIFKMPEVEPSSPTFGYVLNRYSRGFFFCFSSLFTSSLLHFNHFTVLVPIVLFIITHLPVVTIFGLIPDPITFSHWLLEQLNILLFGGTGSSSLIGSLIGVLGSVGALLLSYFIFDLNWPFAAFMGVLMLFAVVLSSASFSNFSQFFKFSTDSCKKRYTHMAKAKGFAILTAAAFFLFFSFFSNFEILSYNVLFLIAIISSVLVHVYGQLRQEFPFAIFDAPFFKKKTAAYSMSITVIKNTIDPPEKFEIFHFILKIFDSVFVFPFVMSFLFKISYDNLDLLSDFDQFPILTRYTSPFLLVFCFFKLVRNSIQNSKLNILILSLFWSSTSLDFQHFELTKFFISFPIIGLFLSSIATVKLFDLHQKFFFTLYSLPTINGFSALFLPNSGFVLANKLLSVVLSAPIVPYCGASLAWICGSPRPLKFWHTNSNSKDPSFSWDDVRRLDGAFYDQMNLSMTRTFARDYMYGRLGPLSHGDVLFLKGDTLNAFVTIVEVGFGNVVFELRGLEFKGTPCHNSELSSVESVLHSVEHDDNMRGLLGFKLYLVKLQCYHYYIFTYSVSENPLAPLLGSYDFSSLLVNNMIHSLVYCLATSSALPVLSKQQELMNHCRYLSSVVEKDVGGPEVCLDWDTSQNGISFSSFISVFKGFMDHVHQSYCSHQLPLDSFYIICYGSSILLRRLLLSTSSLQSSNNMCSRFNASYTWVNLDLRRLLIQAARYSLKLHTDYFIDGGDDFNNVQIMLSRLSGYVQNHIICSERDHLWKDALSSEALNIDTLRTYVDDQERKFSILQLSLQYERFALLKVNAPAVFGQWASAVEEVIFLGNEDAERPSLQSCSTCLRNLTVSSANPPTGYPLAVCSCSSSVY
ncbi:hypothetical protein GEMRC1_013411 [Eukaryota sp. GEM-RC1]